MKKKIKWKVVPVDRLNEVYKEIRSHEKRISSLKKQAKNLVK